MVGHVREPEGRCSGGSYSRAGPVRDEALGEGAQTDERPDQRGLEQVELTRGAVARSGVGADDVGVCDGVVVVR